MRLSNIPFEAAQFAPWILNDAEKGGVAKHAGSLRRVALVPSLHITHHKSAPFEIIEFNFSSAPPPQEIDAPKFTRTELGFWQTFLGGFRLGRLYYRKPLARPVYMRFGMILKRIWD